MPGRKITTSKAVCATSQEPALKQMNKQTEKLTGLNLHKNKESDELRKN